MIQKPSGNSQQYRFRAALLPWGEEVRRDLPWRRTRDPWLICVSEVMLQQTQVSRVIPKWEAFIERFPTVQTCAISEQADVVRMWEGLGYHRRAMNLYRAAKAVVENFGGEFPRSLPDLQSLPGIGAYTARAISAFSFEDDAAVVDTNVGRVLARAFGAKRYTPKQAQDLADELVPSDQGWAWNQAMLDLGAMVCSKRSPQCAACPVNAMCTWYLAGCPEPDPATGSASVSTGQSRFEGSDRQGRGRILAHLRRGPVSVQAVAEVMGWPDDPSRAERVMATLLIDGMVKLVGGDTYVLA